MFTTLALIFLPLLATAQVVPTAPGPNDVFKQGGQCTIQWKPDTSGKWKQTNIELMTGPNQQMVHLATVASVDGTDPTKTSIAITCPAVSPNSAIYFYQFTTALDPNVTWTGRFAISSASGATTPPPNAKQPNGDPIPWGTGKLLDPSQGSPPPSTAPPGQIDGSGSSGGLSSGSPALLNPTGSTSSSSSPPLISVAPSSSTVAAPPSIVTVVTTPDAGVTGATPAPSGASGKNSGASLGSPSAFAACFAALIFTATSMC